MSSTSIQAPQRSRADYRAENWRLQDVARCAARLIDMYTYVQDGLRHVQPDGLPWPSGEVGDWRDFDLSQRWIALWEALITAGAA